MYLNVTEIESALAALHAAYPATSELIASPHPTHGGRTTHVLRVGARGAHDVDGVLLLGGVHAREWVPPDALVSLAADLLEAYADGTGLGYGGASYTAAHVHRIVETLNLFFFACVNPDGRMHSQTVAPGWRKNRRPAPSGMNGPDCVGVDLNRNFDFLWDHAAKFAADSGVSASASPCHPTLYRGPAAASEPETRNVVALLDAYPRIRWHLDVHAAVPVVLHSWGSDENQSTNPGDSFLNPALDAVRGRVGDGVGEYLSPRDAGVAGTLAQRLSQGVQAAHGALYGVEQAMTLYATSGASDDYAFSRHFADPTRTKVYAWTIECGTSFQPSWAVAESVIEEVSSGLIRFALGAHEVTDGLAVTLRTGALAFVDVPEAETTARAIVWDCSGDREVHFEVTVGPTGGFTLPLGGAVTVPAPGFGATGQGRVWVAWTAGPAGATASGTITVRCVETDESWTLAVSANSVPRPSVAVALVLDRSGSMAWGAGDGRTRAEVLREAAGVFLEVLQPENGIGLVRFDHDADPVLAVVRAGPETFGPGRAAAQAAVAAHVPNPLGATSIGDGVTAAAALLGAVDDYDQSAMIVLTDGQENAPAWIADVSASLNDKVFAIGLGAPADINPAALTSLVDGAGGWVGVSGTLSVDDRFLLAQYFLQVLAGATNQQIVTS
ncbi:von Willebrand factor type A domain-containing protein [Tessaracoccus bendigoensis DSM 12906]|uniref:von Willebrand factor type A domain-containing protein n=1 Tax=Tessaracoccus bendigoensis DSM 12906 TaxID=1123357 RepID=A0A1M6JXI5_9ACTN|nr:M14 family zinc carboxypeptidase [Tessaracoccus bendigoensis]SHJ51351.1 von Willebrand factor type A domain-containing protein [Tessaracoccus bendigoensis DSM 12906]